MPTQVIASEFKSRERRRLRLRAISDPYWLATEILGFDKMREDIHGDTVLRPTVDRDRAYFRWLSGKSKYNDPDLWILELLMGKRGSYKTTAQEVRVLKTLLIDPAHTFVWWHAVEDRAKESVQEIASILQKNESFRKLQEPECRAPSYARQKKWSGGNGFDLDNGGSEKTMRAFGAGSEATGGHCRTGILDDIIGHNDIEDSLMPKKRKWLAETASNVIDPDGRHWVTGTHWDEDDIYVDMRSNPQYHTTILPSHSEDGNAIPHRRGQTVPEANRELKRYRNRPGMTAYIFSCQIKNDPLPAESLRWDRSMEQTCTLKEAMSGPGTIFVLSDPAPMGLSLKGDKDKDRGESGKDYWSICVVRLRWRGDFLDTVLLDGDHSQSWSDRDGYERACRMLLKWKTRYFFDEDYTGGQLFAAFNDAAKRMGVRFYSEPDGKGRIQLPKYNESYVKDAKKQRMQKLCDVQKDGAFWMCNTVPSEYLYGDERHSGLLTQNRKWIPLRQGRSNLHYDDDADVVARSTDTKLRELVPAKPVVPDRLGIWALETDEPDEDDVVYRSRRCLV